MPADHPPTHTTRPRGHRTVLSSATVAASLLLSGCGWFGDQAEAGAGATEFPRPADCPDDVMRTNVIAVVGTHANMPRPVLSPADGATTSKDLDCALSHLLEQGGDFTIISVDGDPRSRKVEVSAPDPGLTSVAAERDRRRSAEALTEILAVQAETEGADLHKALALALRTSSDKPEGSVVIVLDNGLTDRGAIDMSAPGWTQVVAREAADQVVQEGQGLEPSPGTTVVLSGLGSAAAPQPSLDITQVRTVEEVWTTLVEDTGATARLIKTAWDGGGLNPTDLKTGVVEPVKITVDPPRPTEGPTEDEPPPPPTFALSPEHLGFESEEATARPPEEVARAVAVLVTAQRESDGTRLRVVGRTDSRPPTRWTDNDELSQARADAVADWLVRQGADGDRIDTVGEGYQACPDDGGPAAFDAGRGALNRLVIISLVHAGEGPEPIRCPGDEK